MLLLDIKILSIKYKYVLDMLDTCLIPALFLLKSVFIGFSAWIFSVCELICKKHVTAIIIIKSNVAACVVNVFDLFTQELNAFCKDWHGLKYYIRVLYYMSFLKKIP